MNHYEILEVSSNASPEVIKAAYRSLMQRYHPDRNPGDEVAAAHSVAVTQAYEVLSDPDRRVVYDRELKLQAVRLDAAQNKARDIVAKAAPVKEDSRSHWGMVVTGILAVLLIWFILSPSTKRQGSAGVDLAGALTGYQVDERQSSAADRMIPVDARTVPAFMKDVSVVVVAPPLPGSAPLSGQKYVLSIQTVGVVAGDFDPDKFIAFLDGNKEYLGRKLTERLAGAKYEMLIRHDGDHYLKQLILNSIGEITGTDQADHSASTGAEPAAHYGAVDILLPDSFSVVAQQADSAAVP